MALLAALLSAGLAAAPPLLAVVDPGHGGEQEGASGAGGLREKQLTLQIARKVARRLSRQGAQVLLTRASDEAVPLARRAALANARGADLFLSIHLNSMPGGASARTQGVETYFLSADASDASAQAVAARENADRIAGHDGPDPDDPVGGILESLGDAEALDQSSRLAYAVHERLVQRLRAEDRGVRQAPFYVLAGARMAAVLVEVGFLSHPQEARRLASGAYQEEVAAAIAEGVLAWAHDGRQARR
jgi:N-acetylmuramoyl-L-alanine amidase